MVMERHCLLPTTPAGDLADHFVWHPSKENKNINHVLPFLRCRLLHQKCSIFLTETHLLGIGRLGTWLIPLTWRFQRSLLSVIIPNSGLGNIRLFTVSSILTIISMHTCTLNLFWQMISLILPDNVVLLKTRTRQSISFMKTKIYVLIYTCRLYFYYRLELINYHKIYLICSNSNFRMQK